MNIDIRTVILLLFLVSGLLALMLFIYWKTQKTYDGFSFWTWGTIISSSAYFLFMLRGIIPLYLSVLVANILVMLSILMRVDGISRFTRSRSLSLRVYGGILVPFALLFLYFTYIQESIAIRALVSSAVIVPGMIFAGYVAIKSGERENRFINYSFAAVLVLGACIYTLRSLYWVFVAAPVTLFSTDNFNSLFFITTLLLDILAAGFFLMLNMVRSQNDLAASEERYRMLADNMPDYVVIHDGSTIQYANPATSRFTEIPADRMPGVPVSSFIAPESPEESGVFIRSPKTDPAGIGPHEIVIQSPCGRKHICIIRNVPFRFRESSAILSVLTDITERKRMEDSLRTVNKKLNLLSGITRHDLRNQLMALDAYIELTEASVDNVPALKEYFSREREVAETMGRQINFTRDYEDLGVKSPLWQNVDALVRKAGETLPLCGITLESRCPGVEVFADPLLEKVFYNLIENSLRYGGYAMTSIRVTVTPSGRELLIVYEDDGTGIPSKDKEYLFTKGFGKNTGLGLFFSREILSITGITIVETGEPGRGARFVTSVPEGAWRIDQA